MIFKNLSDASTQLAQKLSDDQNILSSSHLFTYINPASQNLANLLSQLSSSQSLSILEIFSQPQNYTHTKNIIITDLGDTNSQEYNEFTDKLRQLFPSSNIIIAIPIIPASEEPLLKSVCDQLIFLDKVDFFFSPNQFFEKN